MAITLLCALHFERGHKVGIFFTDFIEDENYYLDQIVLLRYLQSWLYFLKIPFEIFKVSPLLIWRGLAEEALHNIAYLLMAIGFAVIFWKVHDHCSEILHWVYYLESSVEVASVSDVWESCSHNYITFFVFLRI